MELLFLNTWSPLEVVDHPDERGQPRIPILGLLTPCERICLPAYAEAGGHGLDTDPEEPRILAVPQEAHSLLLQATVYLSLPTRPQIAAGKAPLTP